MSTLLKSKSFDYSFFLSQLLMHNSLGESLEWQEWESWWTICKTHKGKPYSSSRCNPAKLKQLQRVWEKALMIWGDPHSMPCSMSNQKTALGRLLSPQDLRFFHSKGRIILCSLFISLFISHSSHEEAHKILDTGKHFGKILHPTQWSHFLIIEILEIESGQDIDFSINV